MTRVTVAPGTKVRIGGLFVFIEAVYKATLGGWLFGNQGTTPGHGRFGEGELLAIWDTMEYYLAPHPSLI